MEGQNKGRGNSKQWYQISGNERDTGGLVPTTEYRECANTHQCCHKTLELRFHVEILQSRCLSVYDSSNWFLKLLTIGSESRPSLKRIFAPPLPLMQGYKPAITSGFDCSSESKANCHSGCLEKFLTPMLTLSSALNTMPICTPSANQSGATWEPLKRYLPNLELTYLAWAQAVWGGVGHDGEGCSAYEHVPLITYAQTRRTLIPFCSV